MSFEPIHYLYLVQELAERTPPIPVSKDAKLRSAISRAYYATYLEARRFLEENTNFRRTRTGDDHGSVKEQFKREHDGKWKRVGNNLDRLGYNRNLADYNDPIPGLENLALLAIEMAQNTLNLIGEIERNRKTKRG